MSYLRNVFWSFTVDVNKLLNVLRTFEEDDSTSEKEQKGNYNSFAIVSLILKNEF